MFAYIYKINGWIRRKIYEPFNKKGRRRKMERKENRMVIGKRNHVKPLVR